MKLKPLLEEQATWLSFLLFLLIPFSLSAASSDLLSDSMDTLSIGEDLHLFATTSEFSRGNDDFFQLQEFEDIIVSIPPLLEKGPHKGELLFTVIHDPQQEPQNLTIPCKADALPAPSYSWFKNGEHFNTDDERVTIVDGEGTIVFLDPQPEDAGHYQCVATNAAGSVYSDVANVKRSMTISFPKGEPRVVTIQLGEPLSLECSNPGGYPQPSLHWVLQKSDGSLRSVSSERATVDERGTLWFSTVTLDDASDDSLYACAASSATSERQLFVVEEDGTLHLRVEEPNEGEFISLNIATEYRMGNWVYLNVSIPPNIEDPLEQLIPPFEQHVSDKLKTVLKGDDIRLFCIYGGLPVPEIRWWKQDKKKIAEEYLVEFGRALEFLELESDVEGRYFCQASNDAGKGKIHTFNIDVEAAPEFDIEPGTINQPIGASATFECSASGKPEPSLSWTFNGEPLNHQSKTYKIESLTINDRGVIACNASNKHGYDYATGFLNVLVLPPEFTTKPDDLSAFSGDAVPLMCDGYGSPDPRIEWFEKGKNTEIRSNNLYEVDDDKLIIKSLSAETAGDYICKAINIYGEVETTVRVNLIASTIVDLKISKKNVAAGDEVSLTCLVTLDDQLHADVTWRKDDETLDFSDSRLTSGGVEDNEYDRVLLITDTKGQDSGVYSCVAKTERDEDEGYVILRVEDKPEPPHIDELECSKREAYIKWNPGSKNNAPLLKYRIEMQSEINKDKWHEVLDDISGSAESTRTSALIELHPSVTHVFRIIAINRVGESEPSPPSESCIAPGAPPDDNPKNVDVETIDSNTLKVSWEAIEPIYHNGPDFVYEVKWRIYNDADEQWSKLVVEDWEQIEVKLDGLRAHTKYEIEVNAVNEHGEAAEANPVLGLTELDVPSVTPTDLKIQRIKGKSAILTWVPVNAVDVFGPLKGYQVEIWRKGEEKETEDLDKNDIIVKGHVTRAFLSDLEPFTEYEAKVRVLNHKFSGPYSDGIEFTTAEEASSPVIDLEGKILSSKSILVKWKKPEDPNGIISNYIVSYQPIYNKHGNGEGPSEKITTEENELQSKLPDLNEETLYKISVTPKNKAGLGQSASINVQTEKTIPSFPVPPVFTWNVIQDTESSTRHPDVTSSSDRNNENEKRKLIIQGNEDDPTIDIDGDGDVDNQDFINRKIFIGDTDNDGDVDINDVLDTDRDGDIDDDDFNVADINNDDVINIYDVSAADQDGDGDVDVHDIDDEDNDGDIDVHDIDAADADGDGDIDSDDTGDGLAIKVLWQPDVENNPGSEFYLKYRPVGNKYWRKSDTESRSLHQTLTGLDRYRSYEVQMVAIDGEFETPSDVEVIGPFEERPAVVPTVVGAVMDETNPWMMTWFIIAIIVAVSMLCIILFSVWVYHRRITQVSQLRAQLYEGYEPPSVIAKKGDVEASSQKSDGEATLTADQQRSSNKPFDRSNKPFRQSWYHVQMAALLRRQETIQSVDSFASHDDDFAEYGDETMVGQTETLV